MQTLTASERRSLRAKAHHLHPVVAIGVHGLTGAVLHEIDVALKAHELVKIRVATGERGEREAFLDRICRAIDCAPVQHLGKLLIVWRKNTDSKTDRDDAKAAPARKRSLDATTKGNREETSAHSRIAAPSATPRAPSRRRARGREAAESGVSDQSRRRRRAR